MDIYNRPGQKFLPCNHQLTDESGAEYTVYRDQKQNGLFCFLSRIMICVWGWPKGCDLLMMSWHRGAAKKGKDPHPKTEVFNAP